MNDHNPTLFGEQGQRKERVEWGLRQMVGNVLMAKGAVDIRPSEQNARDLAGNRSAGLHDTEVVTRMVVTYTSAWTTAGAVGSPDSP